VAKKSKYQISRIFLWWGMAVGCSISLISSDLYSKQRIIWLLAIAGTAATTAAIEHGWFEAPHWLGAVPRASIILVAIWGSVTLLGYKVWPSCGLIVTTEGHALSRLYARGQIPPPVPNVTSHTAVNAQELFYQWTATIVSLHQIPEMSITVDHLAVYDRIRVTPMDAELSALTPRWQSGFPEPDRNPDYYSRNIRIKNIQAGQATDVAVRRPIVPSFVGPSTLISFFNIRTPLCDWNKAADDAMEVEKIKHQASVLAEMKYSGADKPAVVPPLVPFGLGNLGSGQLQATLEVHCDQDEACLNATGRQIEVNVRWQ